MEGSKAKHILLVEDELLIAMDLEALVQELGHATLGPAASCQAALDLLASDPIGAAIVDFVLGEELCYSVADELIARGIPWSLATGFDAGEVEERYRSISLIAKPFTAGDVRPALAKLLDLPAS